MTIVEVKMPQHGASMQDGDIIEWSVQEGDQVAEGQEIVEVDTAKTTFVIEAPATGTIKSILKQADENVPVGDVIAIIETNS